MALKPNSIIDRAALKEVLANDEDFLKPLLKTVVQEVLEAEMDELLQAERNERSDGRLGYRNGHYTRSLVTRIGKLELRVPRDRGGKFDTAVFESYQRSEKALVSCLSEIYLQGVSTRKMKAVTERLCGHGISPSVVSAINKKLEGELRQFAERHLEHDYPYVIMDARYEKVRIDGVIRSQAVLVAVGINWEGRREILGVELANRESHSSWKSFLESLRKRGLRGVELVITDDHAGLIKAIQEVLPEAAWQRCYVHFLRNAIDHLPRKADDDCLTELRWIYDRRDLQEARRDLGVWIRKWENRYGKLCAWVEENVEQTLTFYQWPRAHHKHLKSTNMLERINQELKRRTHVIRIFPNEESCLRLVRALCVEIHEDWIEQHRYLNMQILREHKKLRLINQDTNCVA